MKEESALTVVPNLRGLLIFDMVSDNTCMQVHVYEATEFSGMVMMKCHFHSIYIYTNCASYLLSLDG